MVSVQGLKSRNCSVKLCSKHRINWELISTSFCDQGMLPGRFFTDTLNVVSDPEHYPEERRIQVAIDPKQHGEFLNLISVSCIRRRRTQFIILGVLRFRRWRFMKFFDGRFHFLHQFEWRHLSYFICAKIIAHLMLFVVVWASLSMVKQISQNYLVVLIIVWGS